jgi:predicted RNA methylase
MLSPTQARTQRALFILENRMRIDSEVLAVLSAATTQGCNVTLTGQLDRKLYDRTNKVLEAAGGKWNRKARAHVFAADAADRLDQIILSSTVEVPKDEFNFFPSPPAVVIRLMELAGIERGMTVLEPSAGRGAIAFACHARGAVVDCVELMKANVDTLISDKRCRAVSYCDFLSMQPSQVYDRVVMNPPFVKQADIKHVVHALQFMKPGSLLVAVMAAGVTFRLDARTRNFLGMVEDHGGHIEPLPENSFKASGTGVNTVIAVIPA